MTNPKNLAPLERRTRPRPDREYMKLIRTLPVPGLGNVRFRLHEYAVEKGLVIKKGPHAGKPNRAEIRRRTGASDDLLFYMLRYPDTVRVIHFRALARLCHGLDCQPGDLIVYDKTEDSATPLSETYKRAEAI